MARKGRIQVCVTCGRERYHYARGMCLQCYKSERGYINRANNPNTRKKRISACKKCGKQTYLYAKGLCLQCYWLNRYYINKARNQRRHENRSVYKTEVDMYYNVWNAREHVSFISGYPLQGPTSSMWRSQFAHVIPKSKYPQVKYDDDFVVLLTVDEHHAYDNMTEDQRQKYFGHCDWNKLYNFRDKMLRKLTI